MGIAKEVRTKISSVKNTAKITKAMEMVSASKMRKVQERMRQARPYATKIVEVIKHIAHATTDCQHSFLQKKNNVKNIGVMIVSTDRGLCGGLNANLFKHFIGEAQKWESSGCKIKCAVYGKKGAAFLARLGLPIASQAIDLGDKPTLESLLGVSKVMIDQYHTEEIDQLYLISNQFVNSMTQTPKTQQLLPLPVDEGELSVLPSGSWDYLYEPNAEKVLDVLLRRYIESVVYHWVVENVACEQSARMIAMKSASDNANTIIDELQLIYNKARQAAITQELAEIVSGAEAL